MTVILLQLGRIEDHMLILENNLNSKTTSFVKPSCKMHLDQQHVQERDTFFQGLQYRSSRPPKENFSVLIGSFPKDKLRKTRNYTRIIFDRFLCVINKFSSLTNKSCCKFPSFFFTSVFTKGHLILMASRCLLHLMAYGNPLWKI